MKPKTFSDLFQEAERHEDYWVAGAILEFTESVVLEMNRQGVTRTELAQRLGTTPAYVTKILRGKVNFTLATMVRLARALNSDLRVRLDAVSNRQGKTGRAVGASSPVSAARADKPRKIAATARRPAALSSQRRTSKRSP